MTIECKNARQKHKAKSQGKNARQKCKAKTQGKIACVKGFKTKKLNFSFIKPLTGQIANSHQCLKCHQSLSKSIVFYITAFRQNFRNSFSEHLNFCHATYHEIFLC